MRGIMQAILHTDIEFGCLFQLLMFTVQTIADWIRAAEKNMFKTFLRY